MRQSTTRSVSPILWVLLLVLAFLIVCPLVSVFAEAVIIDGRLDLYRAWTIIAAPENLQTIWNSLLLGVCVVALSTVIAAPTAYLLARSQLGKHKWLDIVFMVPFMTPPYIASMGWILFMQRRGLFQQLFPFTGRISEGFFSFGGLVLVMTLNVFPFMMTILKNAILNIPASLEESGAVFGAGFGLRLRKIFAPLLTGNYAIAALLVFVKTLSEYGTPYTLGRRIGFYVFTTDIHRYATTAPVDFGKAASLSSVLVLICMALWLAQNAITNRTSYRLVSGKGSRPVETHLSGGGLAAAWGWVALVLVVSIGIPYFSIIASSLIKLRGYGLAPGNFTLEHYAELFTTDRSLGAIGNSIFLAIHRLGLHLLGAGHGGGHGGAPRQGAAQKNRGGRQYAARNAACHRAGHRHHAVLERHLRCAAAVQHNGHHGAGLCGAVPALYGAVCDLLLHPD